MKVYILGVVHDKQFHWDLRGVFASHPLALEKGKDILVVEPEVEKLVDLTDDTYHPAGVDTSNSVIVFEDEVQFT